MKNGFYKKIAVWAFGLSFGVNCLSCSFALLKKEEPPPRTEPAPVPQVPKSPTGEKEPVPVKAREAVPSVQEAALSSAEPAPAPGQQVTMPPPQVKAEPKSREKIIAHTVKWSGETLSIISLWYTGDQGNWKAIAQTNPNLNPNRIYVGNEILIPAMLLKTQNSLPKEFVDRFYSKAKKEKPKAITQSGQAQEEEPKLFGPKKSSK